jgi:hypothetical protein
MSKNYDSSCEYGINITDCDLDLGKHFCDDAIRSERDRMLPRFGEVRWDEICSV